MRHLSAVVLLSALMGLAAGTDVWPSKEEEHSKFQVTVPIHLNKKGGYVHKDALFGYPSYYQGTLAAPVYYANGTGCNVIKTDDWEHPFVLLIDRGDCHFTEKVRNAQAARASAVVIADNKCLCSDEECLSKSGTSTCETVLPFMADDGAGDDITIPSMLLRKSDADDIKSELKKSGLGGNVLVQFEWGIPSPDGRVEWTMWHSAWDTPSEDFIKSFAHVPAKLGKRAYFTPHFVSYNGTKVGCRTDGVCGTMCLNKGRYCLLDPSPFHDQESGASGADVVVENLRRICIWKQVSKGDEDGVGRKWWDYVRLFQQMCPKETDLVGEQCGDKVMKKLGLDGRRIKECMQPYGPDVDKVNDLLEAEIKQQTELQLLRLPTVYVDGVHARGRISGENVFGMLCAGYGTHDPPAECKCAELASDEVMSCVETGKAQHDSTLVSSGFSASQVFALILLIVGCMAGVGYVYWRRTQRHMREQVRSILAEYMPLEDQSLPGELDSPMAHPAAVASAKSPRGFMPTKDRFDDEEDEGI